MTKLHLFCILLFISGCASAPRIVVRPESSFTHASTVTVIPFNPDSENVLGKLESLLMIHGFNIISSSMTSTRIEYEETVEGDSEKKETEGSIGAVTRVKADYALKYSYHTRPDFPAGRVFTSFTATVIDVNSGEIIVSADFSQGSFSGKTIDSVLRNFIESLSQEIS